MAKTKVKESKLEKTRASLKEAPTATKVKAWTFQIDNACYVIISYFVTRQGFIVSVFPSNKKGVKKGNEAIVSIPNCSDHVKGFQAALELLLPEEIAAERSELSEVIA